MLSIEIVVPTRNRLPKLLRMIDSLSRASMTTDISLRVICDGDPKTHRTLIERGIDSILTDEQYGSVYCRNLIIPTTTDGVLYAVDDIVFQERAIDNAIEEFNDLFPDDDGVLGFTQQGVNGNDAGIALVGRSFVDRYPNRRLFFPEYFHFACQEVLRASSQLGRFHLSKTAIVYHFHPATHRKEYDRTHEDGRIHRTRDLALSKDRERRGLTWGIS